MRPDFWFGLIITVAGIAVMINGALQSSRPRLHDFWTLALYTQDGRIALSQILPGAFTKDDLKYLSERNKPAVLEHIYTFDGRVVDAEWAKSVQQP